MPLSVVHYPHPTLRHTSRPLKRVDAELRRMAQEMIELMYEHEGIGLAANQVDLPYRMFVINPTGDPDQPEHEQVLINPVLSGGKGREAGREGCLSIPGIHAAVVRHQSIKVQAYDLDGNEINQEVDELHARLLQHETDHLDGVLFTDKLPPAVKDDVAGALQEFEIDFRSKQQSGEAPSDAAIAERIAELEKLRT
ncbi:MAG: peptide deformylase [Planctomycetota bacterium]